MITRELLEQAFQEVSAELQDNRIRTYRSEGAVNILQILLDYEKGQATGEEETAPQDPNGENNGSHGEGNGSYDEGACEEEVQEEIVDQSAYQLELCCRGACTCRDHLPSSE